MDVANSGARDDQLLLVMRADLRTIMSDCLARQSIDTSLVDHEDLGDGLRLIVAADVSPGALIDPFIANLTQALRRHRRTAAASARIRLRVAIHMGLLHRDGNVWAGTPLVHGARLLDAKPLRRVLRNTVDVDLAVLVSQLVYETVVRPGLGPDPGTFHPVSITKKETRATAWIHVPGHRSPPRVDWSSPGARGRAALAGLVGVSLAAAIAVTPTRTAPCTSGVALSLTRDA